MTVEAEQSTSETGHRDEVSGVVVHVLISLVNEYNGDIGVAQALALAGDDRSFTSLRDRKAWGSLEETVSLFNAATLVTGDGTVGLHVGEALPTIPDDTGFVSRFRALGSPEEAFKHISPFVAHFDATCEAAALEVAVDHALVQVDPHAGERHAHLCEMTRGLLSRVPALFGLEPALITEIECSARGACVPVCLELGRPRGRRGGPRCRTVDTRSSICGVVPPGTPVPDGMPTGAYPRRRRSVSRRRPLNRCRAPGRLARRD